MERFRGSLALVVGLMWQRFGTPTGWAESGTVGEFNWALQCNRQSGYPEVKWFFRKVQQFVAPPDPEAIAHAADQWGKVLTFRKRLRAENVFYGEYPDASGFQAVFGDDLTRWLVAPARPWVPQITDQPPPPPGLTPPGTYYQQLYDAYFRLDIAEIDNDRQFDIPLDQVYVRLRVKPAKKRRSATPSRTPSRSTSRRPFPATPNW